MIVAFCGLKGAGKDTAGAYLIERYGFKRISFARNVKQVFCILFGVDLEWVEKHKNNDNAYIELSDGNELVSKLTVRKALQLIGTEVGQGLWGSMFWVNQELPKGIYNDDLVITDLRFPHEANRIKEIGGHIVQIRRTGADTADMHISERTDQLAPYIDFTIRNDGSFNELYTQLDAMHNTFLHKDESA